jgi:hypothetical protein
VSFYVSVTKPDPVVPYRWHRYVDDSSNLRSTLIAAVREVAWRNGRGADVAAMRGRIEAMSRDEMRAGFMLSLPGGYKLVVQDGDLARGGDVFAEAAAAVTSRRKRAAVVAKIQAEQAKRPGYGSYVKPWHLRQLLDRQ